MTYHTASACIPPRFVESARVFVGDKVPICTVIGFPNGYNTSVVKVAEVRDAISRGAEEIDTVIPVGILKSGEYGEVATELALLRKACGNKILKVIIETCLLTREEKIICCKLVSESGADFIKTSTGFSTGGATREDVALMKEFVEPHVKIKAAGGIATLKDAEEFLNLGASRLGTSRVVKLVKGMETKEGY